MSRIAVLISGEYRKFDIARKRMPFLDRADVDVYVSTWDRTVYRSKRVNLSVTEIVTEDRVRADLGRDATILIDQHDLIRGKRYNAQMIDRWKTGFKLIEDSNIQYDFVIVMRPDIFCLDAGILDINMEKFNNAVGFSWATSLHLNKLPDLVFASTYKNIKHIFDNLSLKEWCSAEMGDWHTWWFHFVNNLPMDIVDFIEIGPFTFCRYWVNDSHSFQEALDIQHDWRDIKLLDNVDSWGEERAGVAWAPEILTNAKEKWAAGYFDKYKV